LLCDRCNNEIAAANMKSLLSLPVINKKSATDLRKLIYQFQSNLNAIRALDLSIPLHEVLLSQILVEHVDEVIRKQWEMKAVSQGMTELEAIIKFLEGKCQALELIHASQHSRNNNSSGVSNPTKHAYVATHSSCVLCGGNHHLYRCKQFRKVSSQQRLNLIKPNQLCFNCLGSSHRTSKCKVEWRRKYCSRKHNSLLLCEFEPTQNNNRNDCNNELQRQLSRTEQNNSSQSGVTVIHLREGHLHRYCLLQRWFMLGINGDN